MFTTAPQLTRFYVDDSSELKRLHRKRRKGISLRSWGGYVGRKTWE